MSRINPEESLHSHRVFNNVDQQSSKGGSPPPPITMVDIKCAANHSRGLNKGVWTTPWQMSPDPATQYTQPELSPSVVRIALLHDLDPPASLTQTGLGPASILQMLYQMGCVGRTRISPPHTFA